MSLFFLDESDTSTALVFFCFNRPEHARLGLTRLAECSRLDEVRVIIFCDGPRSENDIPSVTACREVVRELAPSLNAEVVERETNYGLARSITTGVAGGLRRCGRVIVLEDDLVARPDFLHYMLSALDKYQHAGNVYQVCGYMAPVAHPDVAEDAFFLNLTSTWGWATWRRAWKLFDAHPPHIEDALENEILLHGFDLHGTYPYSQMLKDRLAGKNDSWGILWWWNVFLAGGLCLHPTKTLIWVGGLDGSGTHCLDAPDLQGRLPEDFQTPVYGIDISLPDKVKSSVSPLKRLQAYIRAMCGV